MTQEYYGGNSVSLCEAEIAMLLKALEQSTGDLVKTISITDVEVTALNDHRPRFAKQVVITMHRTPGHDWNTTT